MKKYSVSFLIFAFCLNLLSSCGSSSDSVFDNIDLYPVKTSKDGKWSMVNKDGEIVYDSEFKHEPTAAYNGLFSVKEGDGYTVYKADGKKPQAVKGLENLKDVGYLEDGLMPVTFPNHRISIVDEEGTTKFELQPVNGFEVVSCAPGFSEGLLRVKTDDNKYGFVDKDGKYIVKPELEEAYDFAEGLAVVGKSKDKEDSEIAYSVIDKSGKEVFKIKDGYILRAHGFKHGYIVVGKDDRRYLFNKKGEEIKLPSKITSVQDYNEEYIIFRGEEGEYGVADFNGEILIRPKYNWLMFSNSDFFIAKKDKEDKELIKLNAKGDELDDKIDYEELMNVGKFGYFAKEGKTIVLLNDDFEKKGKEEFYDVNFSIDRGNVYTDYFNMAEVAKSMVAMINGDKVGSFQVGLSAGAVMSGKSPRDYLYDTSVSFPDMDKSGFRYKISVSGGFSEKMADYDYDYYSYDRNYYWRTSSKLWVINIHLTSESDWGKQGQEALKNALTAEGYKMIKEGLSNSDLCAVFKKGKSLVVAYSPENGQTATILVVDPTYEESVLASVTSGDKSSNDNSFDDNYDDYDYIELDSVAVDTVAVVEEAAYAY